MSKIERYQGNVEAFASSAQGVERTVFGETTQANDLTSQVTAAFLRGWGVVGPSEHPSLEDFNGAMYALSQFIAYQHQAGIPEWHEEQEYYAGSVCTHAGVSYQSLEDANTGHEPPSSHWTPVLTAKNGFANLDLGEAAKRDVGTEANQIPDMSAFQVIDSPGRGWHVLPNGHIHQYGIATLAAVGNYNKQTIGGVDYYTRYYVVTLPRAYPTAHQVTTVTIAGRSFDNQGGAYGLWATCNRNVDSSGPSLTSFTVSVTTVDPTQVPVIHYSSEGY